MLLAGGSNSGNVRSMLSGIERTLRLVIAVEHVGIEIEAVRPHDCPQLGIHADEPEVIGIGLRLRFDDGRERVRQTWEDADEASDALQTRRPDLSTGAGSGPATRSGRLDPTRPIDRLSRVREGDIASAKHWIEPLPRKQNAAYVAAVSLVCALLAPNAHAQEAKPVAKVAPGVFMSRVSTQAPRVAVRGHSEPKRVLEAKQRSRPAARIVGGSPAAINHPAGRRRRQPLSP